MADRRRRRRRASQDSEDDDESGSGSDSGTSASPSTKNRARESEPPEAAAVRVEVKSDVESECVSSCEPGRILARRVAALRARDRATCLVWSVELMVPRLDRGSFGGGSLQAQISEPLTPTVPLSLVAVSQSRPARTPCRATAAAVAGVVLLLLEGFGEGATEEEEGGGGWEGEGGCLRSGSAAITFRSLHLLWVTRRLYSMMEIKHDYGLEMS